MNDSGLSMALRLNTGHAIRQLDAVIDGLTIIRNRLAEIPDRYCEIDGAELVVHQESEKVVWKKCSKCGNLTGHVKKVV